MKYLILIILSGFTTLYLPAQDETTEPVLYQYYVPIPENSFDANWTFQLEMVNLSDDAFEATLVGMNPFNLELFSTKRTYGAGELLLWNNKADVSKSAGVQILKITSSAPLFGHLWLSNPVSKIYNALAVVADPDASALTLPHMPFDIFSWDTSFFIMGIDNGVSSSSLDFEYYLADGTQLITTARSVMPSGAYLPATPYLDFPLGGLGEKDRAAWARVTTEGDDFTIAGFQSITRDRDAENPFSCSFELVKGPGFSEGMTGLPGSDDLGYQNWLAFTNPNQETTVVDLTLHTLVERIPDLGLGAATDEEPKPVPVIEYHTVSMTMEPGARIVHILGVTLFEDVEGDFQQLSYKAYAPLAEQTEDTVAEEPEALPIYALHLNADNENLRLGAALFEPEGAKISRTVLPLDQADAVFDLYNPHNIETRLELSINNSVGEVLFARDINILPGGAFRGLTSETLLAELAPEVLAAQTDEALTLSFRILNGNTFYAKTRRFLRDEDGTITDIAVVGASRINPVFDKPDFEAQ